MSSKGHDTIMRLRREFDIPEPKDTRTKQEKERDRAEALAREKRIDRISKNMSRCITETIGLIDG